MKTIFFTWSFYDTENTDADEAYFSDAQTTLKEIFPALEKEHPFYNAQYRIQQEKAKNTHFQGVIFLAPGRSITLKHFIKLLNPRNPSDIYVSKLIPKQTEAERRSYMVHYCSKPIPFCGCKHCKDCIAVPDRLIYTNILSVPILEDVRQPEKPKPEVDIYDLILKSQPIKRANSTCDHLLKQVNAKRRVE